jgi:hypothetical protein
VESGYLYPAPKSVFDMHDSIRTEGHCFGTLRRPRDNRQPIANLDDMAAAMDLVQAAYAFE